MRHRKNVHEEIAKKVRSRHCENLDRVKQIEGHMVRHTHRDKLSSKKCNEKLALRHREKVDLRHRVLKTKSASWSFKVMCLNNIQAIIKG